jgi:uncharacterized protein YjbJ (UPF0337 family)
MQENAMNQDQIKGQWDQVVGHCKRIWGELTDDDVLKASGSADKLFGVIQARFGDTKEVIQQKIDKLTLG